MLIQHTSPTSISHGIWRRKASHSQVNREGSERVCVRESEWVVLAGYPLSSIKKSFKKRFLFSFPSSLFYLRLGGPRESPGLPPLIQPQRTAGNNWQNRFYAAVLLSTSTPWCYKNVDTALHNLQADGRDGRGKSICKICTCRPSVRWC